jgi:hypothetical protein
MENKELLKEIDGFEKKSNFSNKMNIFTYKVLKFINNEYVYFTLSFLATMLTCYIVEFNYLFVTFLHFVCWYFLSDKMINKEKIKKENRDIDYLITTIKSHIKTKK